MKLSRRVLLILLGTLLLSGFLIFNHCEKLSDELKNVAVGIFTSSLVVFIIELISWRHEKANLSKFEGCYTRAEIREWDYDEGKYKDISGQCSNNDICLVYKGEGEYKGTVSYGEGKVNITLNFDRLNPNIAKGIYQYQTKDDLGRYEIQVDQNNSNSIYVAYSNVISSNREVSRLVFGFEKWEKI